MAEPQQQDWFASNAPKAAPTPAPSAGQWVDGPLGKTWQPAEPPAADQWGGRRDQNSVEIDHAAIANRIANWASTLRPSLQKPAAFLATLPADALASLVEMFSAPESIAAVGAKPALGAVDAIGAKVASARASTAPFAETLITKKLGMDPEAIQLQATKMRLQAARSQTRQGRLAADIAKTQQSAVTSPVETASGGTALPVGPPPVEAPGGSRPNGYPDQKALNAEAIARRRAEYQARTTEAATPPQPPAPKPTMSAEESKAYLEMRVAGKTDAQAKQAIEASRALNQSLNLKTPTAAEKRFPKGNRGKTTPE